MWHARVEILKLYLEKRLLEHEKRVLIRMHDLDFQRALHRKKESEIRFVYRSKRMLHTFKLKPKDSLSIEIEKDLSES